MLSQTKKWFGMTTHLAVCETRQIPSGWSHNSARNPSIWQHNQANGSDNIKTNPIARGQPQKKKYIRFTTMPAVASTRRIPTSRSNKKTKHKVHKIEPHDAILQKSPAQRSNTWQPNHWKYHWERERQKTTTICC